MSLPKRYDPQECEPRLQAAWDMEGVYQFNMGNEGPVYAIDTPPPTISGNLHMGHVYSYSHADFMARYWRMKGQKVYYPMGFDDNGLPTERLVEAQLGRSAGETGRTAFIQKCLEIGAQVEAEYETTWRRLGLSIDWDYRYRTIDERSQRISQWSFLDLYKKGLAYRREAPAIWCTECHTAIAQADLIDINRSSTIFTIKFELPDGTPLPIATTRPELLPACVALFVHPEDKRYQDLVGGHAIVPFTSRQVPILADLEADPDKGTGVVMCCTFGDQADVNWWFGHNLPLRIVIGKDGRLLGPAGDLVGQPIAEARRNIVNVLESRGEVLDNKTFIQSVRAHERCDTAVEYIVTSQWFVRLLENKETLLAAGEKLQWFPPHMKNRYRDWVENLAWDWCLSRERAFGVPFPVWYCADCKGVIPARLEDLPVNPVERDPGEPCSCGSTKFVPETDVMDTWATSSLTPQIVGGWDPLQGQGEVVPETPADPSGGLPIYNQVFPFILRPQAQEIIRTWAFYTLAKSIFHFGRPPWQDILISGWGIAGEGMGKISKSRGGGPLPPLDMIARYSADAVRYWAASTGPGKDAIISEEKIQTGGRLVTKLWNVGRFSERFFESGLSLRNLPSAKPQELTPADRWILSRTQHLIARMTALFEAYEYAAAKSEVESFFWRYLSDNYLEMAKQRLYDPSSQSHSAARETLYYVLLVVLKLFAPFLPHVTEEIYQNLFAAQEKTTTIHRSAWPVPSSQLLDEKADLTGEILVTIATAIRRFKSVENLPLNTGIKRLQLALEAPGQAATIQEAVEDLRSITRAQQVEITAILDPALETIPASEGIQLAIQR